MIGTLLCAILGGRRIRFIRRRETDERAASAVEDVISRAYSCDFLCAPDLGKRVALMNEWLEKAICIGPFGFMDVCQRMRVTSMDVAKNVSASKFWLNRPFRCRWTPAIVREKSYHPNAHDLRS
jgi:hypothetical protein